MDTAIGWEDPRLELINGGAQTLEPRPAVEAARRCVDVMRCRCSLIDANPLKPAHFGASGVLWCDAGELQLVAKDMDQDSLEDGSSEAPDPSPFLSALLRVSPPTAGLFILQAKLVRSIACHTYDTHMLAVRAARAHKRALTRASLSAQIHDLP